MLNKPRFDPVISRVKLNPEQAVLACQCYSLRAYGVASTSSRRACIQSTRATVANARSTTANRTNS